jgi:16S rRNA (cytosine1402-N4)-methyltransferase
MEFKHEPIMLKECIEHLNIKPNGIYVDGTIGGAGHSSKIAEKINKDGILIGIDRDEDALTASKVRLNSYSNVLFIWGNYEDIKSHLFERNINKVDGILLDLGVSSYQLDEAGRGFSYTKDAELDMRMNKKQNLTAKEIVNNYSEEKLVKVFFDYGEEKYSKRIVDRIVAYRLNRKISTTYELADIIRSAVPNNAIDSFKRIFQALRIEVNGELKGLENTIKDCIDLLNNQGRLCIITFHSLEDRIVKNAFCEAEGRCTCPKDFPICVCGYKSLGKIITKKPIVPSEEEQEKNTRSKSAKLRVFEKIEKGGE